MKAQVVVSCEGGPKLTVGTQSRWGNHSYSPCYGHYTGAEAGSRQVGWTSCVTSGLRVLGPEVKDVTISQAVTSGVAVSFNRKGWTGG